MSHFQYTVRQIKRHPAYSLVVILILGLGIGATTAIYSMVHQVLVRPLPVPEPERLVNLREPGPKQGPASCSSAGPIGWEYCFSYPMFRDLEAEQTVFEAIAAHYTLQMNVTNGDRVHSGLGLLVSGRYFDALELEPVLGRLIRPQDEPQVGESAVAVLSHDYWQNYYAGDPAVLGETLTVNSQTLTVIGVTPPGFTGTTVGNRPQIFVPLTLRWRMEPTARPDVNDRRSYWLHSFARLKPEVTMEQASAVINGLHRGILEEIEAPLNTELTDEAFQQRRLTLEPGARGETSLVIRDAAQPLALLLGITLVVMLIVCVNIANLLTARGAARSGEMAIRTSLGARRSHLVFQQLTELGTLAALGTMLSLPVALILLGIIKKMLPDRLVDGLAIHLDPGSTLAALAVSLLTVLAFGLIPAFGSTRAKLGAMLKESSSKASSTRRAARFRAVLITAQIAFSAILLVLAGLFAQSLLNIARVEPGMDVESLISFQVTPRLNGYGPDRAMALYDRIEQELANQAGVTSVSSARIPVLNVNAYGATALSVDGYEPAPGTNPGAAFNIVGTGFFDTVSIPVLRGRDFTAADTASSMNVAIVNESFVQTFELHDSAVGHRFNSPLGGTIEIVGVVADAKYSDVKDDSPPQFFLPRRQFTNLPALFFYVRGGIEPDALAQTIQRTVSAVDPSLPVTRLITVKEQLRNNVYLDRLTAALSGGYAGLATLLASIGLYGVLSYNVTLRTRELGLRLALGARPGQLRAVVLRQVGFMGLAGGLAGVATAIGLGQVAETMLFGVTGYDPVVLIAAAVVLSAVVLIASYGPARRASSIEPMEALRHE